MNARIPLHKESTDNPIANATNWEDDRDRADELQQKSERQAPLIILPKLRAISKPGDWFNKTLPG